MAAMSAGVLVLQLDRDLESNKTEKHHKDTFKRFFVAAGFSNLDEPSELQKKNVVGQGLRSARSTGDTQPSATDDVAWPDLYDVVIDPG